jgi:hypothetical protein
MGKNSAGRGGVGLVHSRKLNRRTGRLLCGEAFDSFARRFLCRAAIIDGTIGSHFGSRRLPVRAISILLAIVFTIGGTKLILTR